MMYGCDQVDSVVRRLVDTLGETLSLLGIVI